MLHSITNRRTPLVIMAALSVLMTACGSNDDENSIEETAIQTVGEANYIAVRPNGQLIGKALDAESNPEAGNGGTGVFIEGHNVTLSPFYMGETEITYALYKEVYEWGKQNGYTFRVAQDCQYDTTLWMNVCTDTPEKEPFQKGGNFGAYDETKHTNMAPVTNVSWRDAIVWANAYTEMTKGSDAEAVYRKSHDDDSVLKDATAQDEQGYVVDFVFPHIAKKGFRLPTEAEWEYAARYQGSESENAVQFGDVWLTKLWSMSGMHTSISYEGMSPEQKADTALQEKLAAEANRVAVFSENFNGTEWTVKEDATTLAVKQKEPNSLGLYDMSGNVSEFCFDAYNTDNLVGIVTNPQGPLPGSGYSIGQRLNKGGHFLAKTEHALVGFRFGKTPDYTGDYEGFRIAFTQ